MSPAEQQTLLSKRGERTCIAYVAAKDSIRVRTGTWLVLERLLRSWRAGVAFLAILLPAGFSGCTKSDAETPQPSQNTQAPTPTPAPTPTAAQQSPKNTMVLGAVCPTRPLWHRIIFFWR